MRSLFPTLLLAAACSSDQAPPTAAPAVDRPNFLVIDIDSLRADRLRASRAGQPVAPHIAALAERGTWFESAMAQAAWTVPSVAALFTGRHPPALELSETSMSWLGEGTHTLAEILGWYDYTSAIFWGETLPSSFEALSHGFDKVDMHPASPPSAYHQPVCAWLESAPGEPWLAVVHNVDLHAPSARLDEAWLQHRTDLRLTTRGRSLDDHYDLRLASHGPADAQAYVQALYDARLSWYDTSVKRMLGCLERSGQAGDTVVLLISDHGEELFDHGVLGHGRYHFQTVLHVPLIVLDGREEAAGRTVDARVQTIDIAPTVLELAGVPPDQEMEGRSLCPLLAGAEAEWPRRDLYSFSSLLAASLLRDDHKLVLHRPDRAAALDGPRLGAMAPGTRPALYDLHSDPREATDLLEQRPKLASAMQRDLLAFVDRQVLLARGGDGEPVNEAFLQALKEGGYWEQVRRGQGEGPQGRAMQRKGGVPEH